MATLQVPGPILHFVNFSGDPSTYWFLGTAKETPLLRIDRAYMPINMEQGGDMLPFDLAYQGKTAKIVTEINYVDYTIAYLLGCSPRYGFSKFALGRGLDSYRDIGSLALGNKCYFSLFLVFPFATTINDTGFRNPPTNTPLGGSPFSLPQVYRFPACQIEYDEQSGGTGGQELTLAINAQRIFYSRAKYKNTFNGSPLAGGFFLYDHAVIPDADIDSALRREFFAKGAVTMFSETERQIFKFKDWDGKERFADPAEVLRLMNVQTQGGMEKAMLALGQPMSPEKSEAVEIIVDAGVEAFGVKPFDPATGEGWLEFHMVALVSRFNDWLIGLKKST